MASCEPSVDQKAIWSGSGGRGWVETEGLIDRCFRPLQEVLSEAVSAPSARRVLDVGCGTGATTVAIARRLGAAGRCQGIDLSQPMVEAARARAEREGVAATFVCSDAQTHAFDPAAFDRIVSRFGVMFFGDPVQAFANLRGAAADGGELCCIVWRGPEDNPFMTAAERAAEPLLPGVLRRDPDAPGQFGLARPDRVRDILAASGWSRVEIAPLDVPCAFPAAQLDLYLSRLGTVGRALQEADESTRAEVLETVRPAFDRYLRGSEIRFDAACWKIAARAGG